MKKLLLTFTIAVGFTISSYAQVESLAGPRLGVVAITPGITADMINTKFDLDIDQDVIGETGNAFVTLYGWQWESRFADGGDVTGIVEWIALIGGMEQGLFLPSISSLVGARMSSGLEFAAGPNLSLSGIGMVFGVGYNIKSGSLNIPVNIAFVPSLEKQNSRDIRDENDYYIGEEDFTYNTGSRISITLGFNLGR